jgi:hypothetical protein
VIPRRIKIHNELTPVNQVDLSAFRQSLLKAVTEVNEYARKRAFGQRMQKRVTTGFAPVLGPPVDIYIKDIEPPVRYIHHRPDGTWPMRPLTDQPVTWI